MRVAVSCILAFVVSVFCLSRTAFCLTLTFDDVTSLSEYQEAGITFSENAAVWANPGAPSVLETPDGGPYTIPNGLMFGQAGGVQGSVFLAEAASSVSIWALSGPGPDPLTSIPQSVPMYMRAFDVADQQIGEDIADGTLQFDFLEIHKPGIRRLEFFSAEPNNDVWDQLVISNPPDYEADGDVDGGDFLLWQRTLGATGLGLPADGNFNGTVEAADLELWRAHFGEASSFPSGTGAAILVPEPQSFDSLALASVIPFVTFRSMRRG